MTDIPTLTTERLRLRAMVMADWPPYLAMMQSDRARHMGGPFPVATAWGMFCADQAQWHLFGAGVLMIEARATGASLGQVGINAGPLFPEREVGWLIFADAEGQGYAFEAASALINWAQTEKGFRGLVSYIDPQNTRSCRLAERLGAVLDNAAPRPDPGDLVYRHRS